MEIQDLPDDLKELAKRISSQDRSAGVIITCDCKARNRVTTPKGELWYCEAEYYSQKKEGMCLLAEHNNR